jgi:hypothetical protein
VNYFSLKRQQQQQHSPIGILVDAYLCVTAPGEVSFLYTVHDDVCETQFTRGESPSSFRVVFVVGQRYNKGRQIQQTDGVY